jgi:antitoxin component YwqK of YwqJK toxin-antitoxin module
MTCYFHSIRRLLFFLFLAFSGFLLSAQDKPCKPVLKVNRHKEIVLGDSRMKSTELKTGDRSVLTEYLSSNRHKITVRQSYQVLTEFYTDEAGISGNVYREYDSGGKLKMTDSLDQSRGRRKKTYMDHFYSNHVVSSTLHYSNGNSASRVYYSLKTGKDSVIKTWYSNRFPKSILVKGYWQPDSLVIKWDSTGILREYTTTTSSELYYPDGILMRKILPFSKWYYNTNGILEEASHDTTISGMPCEQKKTFYPNGILKSVEYYSHGEACHTWSLYTPEGLLKNKVKKGPPKALEVGVGMVGTEYAPEIFTHVEQSPEYVGGYEAFRKEMNIRMADMLCKSEAELSGDYTLGFIVNESGKTTFAGLEGLNADKLANGFAGLFTGMPKWKPGKLNGRAIIVHFVADVHVKEKP